MNNQTSLTMGARITGFDVVDVRFPTSRTLAGSDAMNPAPDYSAAYVILHTEEPTLRGYGLTFTIGRGTDLCVRAVQAIAPRIVGLTIEDIAGDMAGVWRRLVGESQLRWLGPEKGVVHLAAAAVANAVWDLWARAMKKPVWKLVADLTPAEFISTIDFRHVTDVLAPAEALSMLEELASGKAAREKVLLAEGYPAYTTSAGWLGYSDKELRALCRQSVEEDWSGLKIKVGRDLEEDRRRLAIAREVIGWDRQLLIDANQIWEVDEAIAWVEALAEFKPGWIEEPTSPDDILGHRKIAQALRPHVPIATGEHCHNRIMFKQFLEADAIDVVQLDGCRLAGLNEVLAVLLLAAKFGKPVCPHAGGVGLCEYAQHYSMIDYLCVSGTMEGRMTEYAGALHEHFAAPVRMKAGRYGVPAEPGFSIEMKTASLEQFSYPHGAAWTAGEALSA